MKNRQKLNLMEIRPVVGRRAPGGETEGWKLNQTNMKNLLAILGTRLEINFK
jgi:hypothetical protein